MSFRATKAATYDSIRSRVAQLKRLATDSRTQLAAGPTSANVVKQLLNDFISGKAELTAAAAVSGIAAYVQAQEGDPAYNVVTEWNAMITAADAVISWIVTNFPASGGYVQAETWSASGVVTRTFSAASTAGLRTALQNFENTIS